jgi:hypothetical protein
MSNQLNAAAARTRKRTVTVSAAALATAVLGASYAQPQLGSAGRSEAQAPASEHSVPLPHSQPD